jgi:outer membrane receptor for ferric coprogen and ferric-rhodotorulic acid
MPLHYEGIPQHFSCSKTLKKHFKITCLPLLVCSSLTSAIAIAEADNHNDSSSTIAAEQTVSFTIPAQKIDSALVEFTRQSRAQVVLAEGVSVARLNSIEVTGELSPQKALTLLLSGSELVAQQVSSGDFLVSSKVIERPVPSVEVITITSSYVTDELDTGTGLGLSLLETPQSVSIFTAHRLEDQNLTSLTDAINNIAGISAKETDSARSRFASRGFDINNYQIDGVPLTWSSGWSAGETTLNTSLYERIEVVRGATGLLTGAGNPSASINLVRKQADSSEFVGTTSFEVSRWNNYRANMDLSSNLNSDGTVRGRIVIDYAEGDSFIDLAENQKSTFYATVAADLTDSTLLRVGASYQENNPTASTWGGLPTWFSDGSRTDWERSKTKGADWTYWASTNETYFLDLTHKFSNDWELKFNVSHSENIADEHLLWIYGDLDKTTGLGLAASPRRYDSYREQNDIGLRLKGSFKWLNREHELVAGMTYSKQDHTAYGYERGDIDPVGDFYQWDGSYAEPEWGERYISVQSDTTQKGYYAATRLSLTESFKVIVGARVADWETEGEAYGTQQNYGDNGVVIPYFGMLYDINDVHRAYVSYTEIFQPQSSLDRDGKFLDPLVGQSYETGIKSAFFDGALSTTVTLFRIEQDNLAVTDTGFYIPNTEPPIEASRAAQGTVSKGYEIEVVGEIVSGWDVSFSFTDFSAVEGSDVNPDQPQGDVNTHQPRSLMRLFSTYDFSGVLENLTIGGGVNWEKTTYTDSTNPYTGEPERLEQPSYSLVNLMVRYQFNDQLSTQFNIDNVLDETYYSQIGFYSQYAYGEPRNISLNLKYQF